MRVRPKRAFFGTLTHADRQRARAPRAAQRALDLIDNVDSGESDTEYRARRALLGLNGAPTRVRALRAEAARLTVPRRAVPGRGPTAGTLLSDEDSPSETHDKPTATPIATPPPSPSSSDIAASSDSSEDSEDRHHMDKKREYEQRQEALLDVTLRRQRDLIERRNKEQRRGPAVWTEISLSSDEDSPSETHDTLTATPIATPPPSSNTWLGGFHEYLWGIEKGRTEEAEEGLRAAVSLL